MPENSLFRTTHLAITLLTRPSHALPELLRNTPWGFGLSLVGLESLLTLTLFGQGTGADHLAQLSHYFLLSAGGFVLSGLITYGLGRMLGNKHPQLSSWVAFALLLVLPGFVRLLVETAVLYLNLPGGTTLLGLGALIPAVWSGWLLALGLQIGFGLSWIQSISGAIAGLLGGTAILLLLL